MSNSAYQLQFAAELFAMLVAAAGLVLVVLRADLTGGARWARAALAAGFVAVGAAAFVRGSLLSSDTSADARALIGAVRLLGDVALAAGCLRWRAGRRVRQGLGLGVALGACAAGLEVAGGSATAMDILLIAGGAGVAVVLVVGSRQSIVARVAAGAAGTLLLMVLVLSIALSSVISNAEAQDQLASLSSRAQIEGAAVGSQASLSLNDARSVAADLQGFFRNDATVLIDLQRAGATGGDAAGAAMVAGRLGQLAGLYPTEGIGYVVGSGRIITPPAPSARADLRLAASSATVAAVNCSDGRGHSSVTVVGQALVAVAAYPECLTLGDSLLGVVVVATPLGDSYLAGRHQIDPSDSLALVAPRAVVGGVGPQLPAASLELAVAPVLASGRSTVRTEDGRQLAIAPLASAAGAPVAALVVSTSESRSDRVRNRLERTLFLIALGGTVIALLFVAAIGDRITAGLRQLTEVAVRIRRGGSGERAGISAGDEVGALGAAFDSMVDAIEEQTGALLAAADDETRLRNRLEAVVAGMGDALVATDESGRVTEFNAAAELLSGVSALAAIGAALPAVLDVVGEDGTRLSPRLGQPGSAWTQIGVLRRGDGEEIPVAVSAGILRGPEGVAAGGVSVLRDLRREHELERMKTEFLSRVGHELRTPLTAIVGYSEILMHRRSTPDQSIAWHQEILASAKRLTRIVEMLEFVASSGAGRVMIHPESFDAADLMGALAAAWSERLGPGYLLVQEVAVGVPPLYADRRWLRLALDELVDNAAKFSPGGGQITLRLATRPDGDVELTVADRGVGMTPQEQAMAFGEFVQVDPSDTRRFGGLGLGLALVQRVVEAHGGSILCDSAPGVGTRLTVRLPPDAAPQPGSTGDRQQRRVGASSGPPKRAR